MKNQKMFYGIALAITVFFSCSDVNETQDENSNKETLNSLIVGEWLYQTRTLNGEDFPFTDSCRGGENAMDFEVFRADNSFQLMDFDSNGSTNGECSFEEDESFTGTWTIDEESSMLTLEINNQIVDGSLQPAATFNGSIIELNDTSLTYSVTTDFDGDGVDDEITMTYLRQ